MKADISLAERRALEREQQAEIRAALVRRHFLDTLEEMAVDAALVRLEIEQLQSFAPVINAMRARKVDSAVPTPVVTVELEPVAPTMPAAVRANAPDLPFDLRQRLGLQ